MPAGDLTCGDGRLAVQGAAECRVEAGDSDGGGWFPGRRRLVSRPRAAPRLKTGQAPEKFPAIVTLLVGMADRFCAMLDCVGGFTVDFVARFGR